jgi:heat shock protein HtpX
MTGAKVIDHDTAPQLFNLVHEITIASGLPMPKVAIVEDDAPNAFATGRDPDHAVIAFTTGILRVMDREQLQGVAAHELAHVANRDTLVSAVAATTAGAKLHYLWPPKLMGIACGSGDRGPQQKVR